MFDGITYEKGASILRMLEAFVTPETFQRGIHDYLSAHAFANAKTEELWQSIGAATKGKIPVPEVMRPWVYQAGFPLLTVGSQEPSKLISIEQCRYLQAPDAVRSNSLWSIPIVFHGLSGASDSSKEPSKASQFTAVSSSSLQKLLNLRKDSVELANNTLPAFANKDGNGFYRVRYAQQDFEKIANNFSELTPEERLAFFSDTKALAVAGLTNLDNWLNLLLKVKFEKDPLVASQIVACYGALYPAMDSKSQPSYQKFIAGNLKTLKDSLGWQPKAGESESTKDLRAEVSQMIGTYGQDKETIREAFALFNQYMADRNAVNPDLVPTVLRIVAYNGGTQEYAQILAAWKSAKSPEDEKRFLLNLCDFRDKELVARTLDLILDGQIRAQDAPLVLSKLLSDRQNGKQAWQFTKTNWSKILKALPPTKMDRVASACSNFYLRSDEDDLKTFFANHKVPFGESALARALEDVHINVMFFERSAEQIRQWVGSQAQAVDADKT
jgi:aminopeptidase N